MRHPKFLIFSIFSVILAVAVATSFGQSTDRDNPTQLNSSEITGVFGDHQQDGNKEIFYSFTAGPGQLTITFDIRRRNRNDMAGVSFELLPRNGSSTALLCCEGVQTGDGGTGRETATVNLTRRQTVILHITNASNGGGIFTVRLSGASISFENTAGGGYGEGTGNGIGYGNGNGNNDDNGRRDRNNERLDVPASGTLHIRMKNGTTQDIDLRRIRSISVRP